MSVEDMGKEFLAGIFEQVVLCLKMGIECASSDIGFVNDIPLSPESRGT